MTRVTEPLREEHKELLPHIEALREAGDAAGETDSTVLKAKVDEAYAFLTGHLIPHAMAEDKALYPVVAGLMGAEEATKTMSRDHVEVGTLTEELGTIRQSIAPGVLDDAVRNHLRQILYGLYALVKVHFAKEEEIYLPILDERLDEPGGQAMFKAMDEAAAAAKALHRH